MKRLTIVIQSVLCRPACISSSVWRENFFICMIRRSHSRQLSKQSVLGQSSLKVSRLDADPSVQRQPSSINDNTMTCSSIAISILPELHSRLQYHRQYGVIIHQAPTAALAVPQHSYLRVGFVRVLQSPRYRIASRRRAAEEVDSKYMMCFCIQLVLFCLSVGCD